MNVDGKMDEGLIRKYQKYEASSQNYKSKLRLLRHYSKCLFAISKVRFTN